MLSRALADAEALVAGGLDGFIVENFGDAPFYGDRVPVWTVADMAVLVERIRAAVGDEPLVGVNVLRNDAGAALAIAAASGAAFIRVNVHTGVMHTDQGTLSGRAADTLRQRRMLDAEVEILADVAVKHAIAPAGFDLAQAAKDTAYRGLADGLIVTGSGTGAAAADADVEAVKRAVPDRAVCGRQWRDRRQRGASPVLGGRRDRGNGSEARRAGGGSRRDRARARPGRPSARLRRRQNRQSSPVGPFWAGRC